MGEVSLLSSFTSPLRVICDANATFPSEICSADAEERSIVLGIMNAFGYAVNAWLPYLVFPAVDAPRFHKGFIFASIMFVAQAGITWAVWWMQKRETRKKVGVVV
jgi:ACS family pantothenate transporter-like MFS transporter